MSPQSDFWYNAAAAMQQIAGQVVTPTTAQKLAAVWACKVAIAESLSMLPCTLLDELDETQKVKDSKHPLFALLRDAPNPLMDSFTFFETLQHAVLDDGNGYAHILRTKSGRVLQLLPLLSEKMQPKVLSNGALVYNYRNEDGTTTSYPQSEIFHLKIHSKDGITGRSPLKVAAEAVASGLAIQQHGNKTFENGAFLNGFIKVPFKFNNDEARENFMNSFKKFFGVRNSGKNALLEQGTDWAPFTQNNTQAQFLELREFTILEICRLFRVPPVFCQVMDKGMAFSSVEQLAILFVQYTIQPWVTRWERAIKFQLLGGSADADRFVRFNINALLRGDLQSRTTAIVSQLGAGLATINEARHLLDHNAIDDPLADELLLSNNLRPATAALPADGSQDPGQDPMPVADVPAEPNVGADRSLADSVKPLFTDLLARLFRREQEQLKTALSKRSDFVRWTEEFYKKHRSLMRETLDPACFVLRESHSEQLDKFLDAFIDSRVEKIAAGASSEAIVESIRGDSTDWNSKILQFMEC